MHCNCLKKSILSLLFITIGIVGYTAIQEAPTPENAPFFNVNPTQTPASYLYAPGLMATEMAMGRYCPRFTAITGEKFTFKSAGHVIGQPHTAVIFPEIDLRKPGCSTWNPITAYLNRIRADLYPLFSRIFQEKYNFEVEDNPNSELSVINYSFNFGQANGAQEKDIKAIYKTYQEHLKKYPDTDIVLFGDSRGSTTLFNFIAQYNPTHVKAAVLESIYDDMQHYMKHLFYIDKGQATEDRLLSLYNFLVGSYKKDGISARKCAEFISDDIPLLFVGSLEDGLVYPQCVIYLYCRLKERGHKNIHFLMLKKSSHPCYMLDNEQDRQTYEHVVHAFYKQYDLPYNHEKAAKGQPLFALSQPSAQELEQMYQLPRCPRCFPISA